MQKLSILILLLVGCNQPKQVTNVEASFVCKVRPVIITRTATSQWNETLVSERIDIVNPIYTKAKIRFDFLPIEYLEKPWLNEIKEAGFDELCQLAKIHAEQRRELAVYFVENVTYKGIEVGGLSNFPSNLLGSSYQHGVVIAYGSFRSVIAHELGHSFNLSHPWQDDAVISDTPSRNPDDCVFLENYCNIMSYCDDFPLNIECDGYNLSVQQCQMIRNWAACYPRNLATTCVGSPFRSLRIPVYTNNIEPAMTTTADKSARSTHENDFCSFDSGSN